MDAKGGEFSGTTATYAVPVHAPPRLLAGPIVMTVGAVVALVGSFQRWLDSGSVGRTSYELLGLIHRLGFVPNGATRMVVRSWPVMPLLLTAGVVTVWWGWRAVGAAVGTLGAFFAGAIGGVVAYAAPETRVVKVSSGPATTAVGAGIVVLGALLVVLVRAPSPDANRRRRSRPAAPSA